MADWYDNLHEDVVVEFPFGRSIGLPERVEGKEACSAVFASVSDDFGVRFSRISAAPLLEPHRVLLEYAGYSDKNGVIYDQRYICIQEFKDGKLVLYREFLDTSVLRDALAASGRAL